MAGLLAAVGAGWPCEGESRAVWKVRVDEVPPPDGDASDMSLVRSLQWTSAHREELGPGMTNLW